MKPSIQQRQPCFLLSLLLFLLPANGWATDVGGPIDGGTTWTAAQDPYVVTADVIVRNGATLTIEPGVTVRFQAGRKLWVGTTALGGGTLVADALAGSPIVFTSDAASPAPGDWAGIEFLSSAVGATFSGGAYVSGSVLRNCLVEHADVAIESQSAPALIATTVRHSLSGALVLFAAGVDTARILDCTFEENGGGTLTGPVFLDSTIPTRLSGCRIRFNTSTQSAALTCIARMVIVEDSEISGNACLHGVKITNSAGFTMRCSSVMGNAAGGSFNTGGIVLPYAAPETVPIVIEHSNIAGNAGYGLRLTDSSNYAFPGNWWGTTDPAAIAAEIYDGNDDPTVGIIAFEPPLSGPVTPGAGCEATPVVPETWGALKARYRE